MCCISTNYSAIHIIPIEVSQSHEYFTSDDKFNKNQNEQNIHLKGL